MAIQFTCPHCGATKNVADHYAGQTGPCAECGQPVTIPGKPMMAPPPKPSTSRTSPLVIVLLVLVVGLFGCGGILIALLLPAVQAAREAARRAQCANNLRQIGLALHNYHDTYGTFPPAYMADEDGKPMHSWRVLILPFLESQQTHSMYNFNEPWNSPSNSQLVGMMPAAYRCPSDPATTTTTGYVAISGNGTVFNNGQGSKFMDITDGTSNTVMVAEIAGGNINWMEPRDLDIGAMNMAINSAKDGSAISSFHPGGAQVLFADGSVRFLSENVDRNTLNLIMQRADGQPVAIP